MRINPTAVCDVLVLDKTPDAYGEPCNEWLPSIRGIFCEISPILGREMIQAMSTGVSLDAKIRCRWIAGIANDMRIQDDSGRMWDIISAIDVGDRHTELLMYTRQVRDNGKQSDQV